MSRANEAWSGTVGPRMRCQGNRAPSCLFPTSHSLPAACVLCVCVRAQVCAVRVRMGVCAHVHSVGVFVWPHACCVHRTQRRGKCRSARVFERVHLLPSHLHGLCVCFSVHAPCARVTMECACAVAAPCLTTLKRTCPDGTSSSIRPLPPVPVLAPRWEHPRHVLSLCV